MFRVQSLCRSLRDVEALHVARAASCTPRQLRQVSSTAVACGEEFHSYINGQIVKSDGAAIDVVDPVTEKRLGTIRSASKEMVDDAVASGLVAQQSWAGTTGKERAGILNKAAQLLQERNDDLAHIETRDTGRPIAETSIVDIVSARDCMEYFAGIAPTLAGQHLDMGESFAYTRREPLGACGGIGAWNYPIQSAAWKAAPALACGNSLVFKPSERTPWSAIELAKLLTDAGLPDGLFNVVVGAGEVGEHLCTHPDISKVSFTGSLATGTRVYQHAADGLKRVTLELGGKSPLIIFNDADIKNAVSGALMANFYSAGQVCSNGTRVFIQDNIYEEFVEAMVERAVRMKIGDPMDPETDMGPLIDRKHLNSVMKYVNDAVDEGATVLCGGNELPVTGCFMEPTILGGCSDDMTISREEVFGPVMTVYPFGSEEEVIKRANDTKFGLAAGVFTADIRRAHRIAKQFESGMVYVNNFNLAPVEIPWGGYKQSGIGRENGVAAVEQWTQLKSVYVEMGDVWCPYS